MYEKKNFTYIMTILESIEKILLYTKSFSDPDSFFGANEQMNFNASQILLLVIGEEVKKIDNNLKEEHKGIPWSEILVQPPIIRTFVQFDLENRFIMS